MTDAVEGKLLFALEVDDTVPDAWRPDIERLEEKVRGWGFDSLAIRYAPVTASGFRIEAVAVILPSRENPGGLKVEITSMPGLAIGPTHLTTPELAWPWVCQQFGQNAEDYAR